MTQFLEDVINVITRAPETRSDADINGILPWLRRRTELLPQLDQDTVMEVVRHCGYEIAERDDVILRQGEEADNMYIILQGTVSIYIDATLTGEEVGDQIVSPGGSPSRESPDNRKWRHLDRDHFGRFIIKYENGKHFGEAAMIGEDKNRNATIVADEHCDLLVIPRALFDRCLTEHQQKEYQMLHNFVDHHPLFHHMPLKFKRLLELSLRREDFHFDTTIVAQGQRHKALYFILSGQANILIEPAKHQKQYSHLWPFEVGTDIYSQEFEWLRESRKAAILRKYEDPAVLPTKPDSLVLKRTEGYVASERSMQEKTLCLCSVQYGEIIGDAELVYNLSTYMQTVLCTANTQTLVLDLKNLERVTGRRNTLTMQVLKETVVDKLAARQRTQHGQQIPFLHFLHAKLTEQELPEKKALPPLKVAKNLPSKDVQTQHMLERYLQGKAELVEPCVPGTLIYKDIMEEKTRIRTNIRRRSQAGVNSMLRDARRKMNRRKPRSRREIVESLKEMIEAELVDASREGPQKGQQTKTKTSTAPAPPKPTSTSVTPRRTSLADSVDGGTPRRLSLAGDVTPRRLSFTGDETPRRLSLTEDSGTPRKPLRPGESPRDALKKSSIVKDRSTSNAGAKKRVTLPPLDGGTKKTHPERDSKGSSLKSDKGYLKSLDGPNTSQARSNSKVVDTGLPQILEEREETSGTRDSNPPSAVSSSHSRYVKREVQASSDGPTPPTGSAKRLPPLAKVELKRPEYVPNDRWSAALRFVNDRMHDSFTKQLLQDGGSPSLNDYETSEGSLQLLESRIKQFHVKYGEFSPVRLNLKLPKLRRFKLDLEDETQNLPKPGGKVWIKKRMCQIANSKFKVKGHEHIRYHIVPELPEFDKVKKMQVVMQQLMDNSVLKRQVEEVKDEMDHSAPNASSTEAAPPNLGERRASFV